jgi:murein L,D-transpeptidase YcbB/YkuD
MNHLTRREHQRILVEIQCAASRSFTYAALALVLLLAISAMGQSKAAPKPVPKTASASTLQSAIQYGRLNDLRWPNFSDYRAHIDRFYRTRSYRLAWTDGGKPTPRAQEMIDVLLHADLEGLNPDDYDGPRWSERIAQLSSASTPQSEFRFDLALTVCAMRYISDIRIGRINPNHFKFGFDVEQKKLDLPAFLQDLLTGDTDLKAELQKIEPPFPEYKAMQKALVQYMAIAKEDPGEKLPDAAPIGMIFRGGKYPAIAQLTKLLHLTGDLPADVQYEGETYDGPLLDAVKRFQQRHDIAATGNLTQETVDQLNVPMSARLEQIKLTLERFRWLRHSFPTPPVVVNLPAFRLYAFDAIGHSDLSMMVNVGDEMDFHTPVFENNIRYIVFRPYWNVPPEILRNEVIPDIADDRAYVRDTDMEVVTSSGQVVTSGVVSDAVLKDLRAGRLTVHQKPGPENALGLVKIMFPNEHHVYLHDTPRSAEMFYSDKRSVSHGCIHMEHPAELAQWLLRNQPGWGMDRVEKAMESGRDNFTVNLTKPVPILIVYGTASVDVQGIVHFYRDVYGYDATLEAALAKGYPYP